MLSLTRSVENPDFLPRLEWAARTAEGVALWCAFALPPATEGFLLFPGFGAFVSVMVTERTLGKTTLNVVGCAKGGAYACFAAKVGRQGASDAVEVLNIMM